MEIKYLENLYISSQRAFSKFKKENVLNSVTLREMFSPEYIYRGRNPFTYLVKSVKTNQPVEIAAAYVHSRTNDLQKEIYTDTYQYNFYDTEKNKLGYKYFYIQTNINNPKLKEMLAGYMEMTANDTYKGLGILSDTIQIKEAINNNIKRIPRSSLGPATLYHVKMGFLPETDDLLEVKSEFDVNRYMNGIAKRSPDLNPNNLLPIILKDSGRYFIDVSRTQALANVAEIKDRLAEGYSFREISYLDLDSLPMSLSGKEMNHWKNLIFNKK